VFQYGKGHIMGWILIFYLNTPNNYQVHSHYDMKVDCSVKESYYNNVFKEVGTKLVASCKPKEFVKYAKKQGGLIYKQYELR
jgi:hypothetical protein